MMKNSKRWVAAVLSFSIILGSISMPAGEVNAASNSNNEKEEVVYAMLDENGKTKSVHVVNIFGKGDITDYGDYSSVKMLTSTTPITQDGEKVTFSSDSDKIYYQGTLDNAQIPWNICIQYQLDGNVVTEEELAGASGTLEIDIKITRNSSCKGDFYDAYALQAAVTLDTVKCKNIAADGAALANVGADKQINYTVLPGKGLDAAITADVSEFEMDAVTINGIKLDLNLEIDDKKLMDKVGDIMDASNKLNDGANDLSTGSKSLEKGSKSLNTGAESLYNGADSLDEGVSELSSGIAKMNKGLKKLNTKSASLTNGSDKFMKALKKIQSGLSNVTVSAEQLKTLTDSSSEIKTALGSLYDGAVTLQSNLSYEKYKTGLKDNGLDLDELKSGNTKAIETLSGQIKELQTSITKLKAIPGYEENSQYAAQVKALEEQVKNLNTIAVLLKGNNAAIGGTKTYLDTVSAGAGTLVSGLSELKTNYEKFDAAIISLSQQLSSLAVNMSSLKVGINSLVTNYKTLDKGIDEYTEGVATVVANYSKLVKGVEKLASGSKRLVEGAGVLKSGTSNLYDGVISLCDGVETMTDGTSDFYDKTSDMDEQVQDQIDEMIASVSGNQTKTVSFVSDRNTNIDSVQFVLKTAAIEQEEVEMPEDKSNDKRGFWQKFLHLFGVDQT